MIKKYLSSISLMLVLIPLTSWSVDKNCFPPEMIPDNMFPTIKLETSMGDIEVELNRMRAPATVNNFLRYVLEGEYDGTYLMNQVMVCRISPAALRWPAMKIRIRPRGSSISI